MARKTTIKAFGDWIRVDGNEARVLELIKTGTTLQKASLAVKQPYTCLREHFNSTPELTKRYEDARRSWVEYRKDQLIEKADKVKADRDEILKVKLQAEVLDNQAKRWDREAWGERVHIEKDVRVEIDAGLLGSAGDLLKRIAARAPRVVEGEAAPAMLASPPAVDGE